jgi:hypothetical protein
MTSHDGNRRRPEQAKPNQPKEQKMKLKTQILAIALGLAATTSLVCGQDQQPAASSTRSIVGTWQVLEHRVDCQTGKRLSPNFPGLITFNQGGTLNAYALFPGSSPFDSPEYGNWSRVPNTQTYKFRDVSYGYDENGTFIVRAEVTATATLDGDADTMKVTARVDGYDAQGNLFGSLCSRWTGTRFQ